MYPNSFSQEKAKRQWLSSCCGLYNTYSTDYHLFTFCLISVEIPWGFWEFWKPEMRNWWKVTHDKEKGTSSGSIASARRHNGPRLALATALGFVLLWRAQYDFKPFVTKQGLISHFANVFKNGNESMEAAPAQHPSPALFSTKNSGRAVVFSCLTLECDTL